jgi:hypothetical protein
MFYVISAKLSRQVNPRFANERGYLVLNNRADIIERFKTQSEARQVCRRLNDAYAKMRKWMSP